MDISTQATSPSTGSGLVAWVEEKNRIQKKRKKFARKKGRNEMNDLITIIFTAGGILTIVMLIVFWNLHTQWGKSLIGIFWFFFVAVVFATIASPWIIRGFGWGVIRNQEAFAETADMIKATNPDPFITTQDVDGVKYAAQNLLDLNFSGGVSDSDSSSLVYQDGQGGQIVPGGQQVVMVIRQDAGQKWNAEKMPNPRPSDWLPEDQATTDLLPAGATCLVVGDGSGSKLDEVWTWTCNNSRGAYPNVGGWSFFTNGFVARDSRSFKISKTGPEGTVVYGTGDWRTCASCWEPQSGQPQQPVVQSDQNQQPVATPTNQTDQQGKALKIVDKSAGGAWTYTPVGNSCVGVNQTHVDAIPFDTPVTLVETFTGAGWTSYMGSSDLALVDWNGAKVCIFAGAAK